MRAAGPAGYRTVKAEKKLSPIIFTRLFFTGIIPTIDMFNLPIFLFITPMFLFSGTFFPISGIPAWAGIFSLVFPLYHLVELTRFLCIGAMESRSVLNLALGTMKRKLIK